MDEIINDLTNYKLKKHTKVSKKEIIELLNEIIYILFPNFFENININEKEYFRLKIENIKRLLQKNIEETNKNEKIECFLKTIPEVRKYLEKDIDAYIKNDPSATTKEEIILSYPGIYAIAVYRAAHELYKLKIPYIPRIMAEEAHSKTGIDIHPGATIKDYFFIDHGTGIVIGETAEIGSHAKIYQGVTLGAISINNAQKLKGIKRHPTIGNNVTIYSGASILGGNTIIEDNVTIGCNAFITKTIESGQIIINNANDYMAKKK